MAAAQENETQEELRRLLSKFTATTSDYLIRSYFAICNITSGSLYEKCARRLNNVIMNNFSGIFPILASVVFVRKSFDILKQTLDNVRYYSILYPNLPKSDKRPVIIQYFDFNEGIQHRMLEYVTAPSSIAVLVSEFSINKVIGFCGDYGYKDAISYKRTTDHLDTLRILSGNKVADLPYSDGFLTRLFDMLLDYLPVDVIKPVLKLGDTLLHLGGASAFVKDIILQYRLWLKSDEHILATDYVQLIIKKFDSLNSFMKPFQFLPSSVVDFFESLQHKILLIFMKDIYAIVSHENISDNSAVAFYLYLNKIRSMFEGFSEDRNFITRAMDYLSTEVEFLVCKKYLDPETHRSKIDKCFKDIAVTVDLTLARAIAYITALINEFDKFDAFTWLLLDQTVSFEQVHSSFHNFFYNNCDSCDNLQEEVKVLNAAIIRLPLLQVDNIASRWIMVFKEYRNVLPSISVLVEILLSFPCTFNFLELQGSESENIARYNFQGVDKEYVINNINEFFNNYLEDAEVIIRLNKINFLED